MHALALFMYALAYFLFNMIPALLQVATLLLFVFGIPTAAGVVS
jgi:hypothetical protein